MLGIRLSGITQPNTAVLEFGNRRISTKMEPSASQQPVISPEDVLESLMNDGTIDAMRLKIITQLKANEELKNTTIKMVEQSKVLNTPGAEKQTKRELFDALRHELETPVLEKASKSVWELILDENGLGKEINETVEKVFCRLSGREPPLFTETCQSRSEKGKEKQTDSSGGGGGGGGGDPDNVMYHNSDLPSKKRKLDELIIEESPGEIAGSSASLNDTTIQVLPPSTSS